MVVLCVVKVRRRDYFRGDTWKSFIFQPGLEDPLAVDCLIQLPVGERINTGPVLGANVVPLLHTLGRVVTFPERLQQGLIAHNGRVKCHQHDFVVTR